MSFLTLRLQHEAETRGDQSVRMITAQVSFGKIPQFGMKGLSNESNHVLITENSDFLL